MLKIHGLSISSNTTKALYVAEELGLDYEYQQLDLKKGEHKTNEHLRRHPLGKLPTLTHDEFTLFESNSICRYLASHAKTSLYPIDDNQTRSRVDQWMDFYTNHLGRWINVYAFEAFAKEKYGFGVPNKEAEKEALGFIEKQMPAVDKHLADNKYFVGDQLSIADLVAFSYMENAEQAQLPIDNFQNIKSWYSALKSRESIKKAHQKLS